MIAIVDYGAGNVRSVQKALEHLGEASRVTSTPADVIDADAVILPGVGAAAAAMQSLAERGLVEPLRRVYLAGRPFFGVCLGLQVLLTATEEGGRHACLGLLRGPVRRLPTGLKVPHMGWNQLHQTAEHWLFAGIPQDTCFYFVHSYYAAPDDASVVIGETDYGLRFCSVVVNGKAVATQFHPEKSGRYGLRLYRNFLDSARLT